MRIFCNKKTGNIYLLTFINSLTGVFVLEDDHIEMKFKVKKRLDQETVLKKYFEEIGYL